MKRVALSLVLACAFATPAHAEKSLTTARWLSGVGSGTSGALFLAAFLVSGDETEVNLPVLFTGLGTGVFTPSLGGIYAGEYLTLGMGLRLGAGLVAAYAVLGQDQNVRCPGVQFDNSCTNLKQEAYLFIGLAGIMFVGGAAYDIKELPTFVDAANRRERGMALTPTLLPTTSGDPAFGLAALGTF